MRYRTSIVLALTGIATVTLLACTTPSTNRSGEPSVSQYKLSGSPTMIVPFSPGGGSDLSGRAIAAGLERITDLNFTTENREGGSGAIGYSYFLSKEGQDNFLLPAETALLALPLTQTVEFDFSSFTPIMKLGDDFTLLAVHEDSEFRSCEQVVTAARDGRVVAAVSGATSLDEIVLTLVEQDQGVRFARVPYESGGEVLAALLGKHVDVASLNPSEVIGQIEAGGLRALCAFSEQRYDYPALASIPTAAEQGIEVAFAQFRGLIAPGGIGEDAKAFWISAAQEYGQSEEYASYIEDNFLQPNTAYGDDFIAYLTENNASLKAAL